MKYNRRDFIQQLVRHKKFKNYLEIGVFTGQVFFKVSAKKKVAVDPEFRFGLSKKFFRTITHPNNLAAQFIEKTSDDFFAQDAPKLYANDSIDICLVDGMHEYQFALRDVRNTLKYLQQKGVIILHDCNPQTREEAASFTEWQAKDPEKHNWTGDVWKAIVHLRSTMNDIDVFVLDCDFGLGFVTRNNPESKLSLTPSQIGSFSYDDLARNRKEWLNLKPAAYFFEYFNLDDPNRLR